MVDQAELLNLSHLLSSERQGLTVEMKNEAKILNKAKQTML